MNMKRVERRFHWPHMSLLLWWISIFSKNSDNLGGLSRATSGCEWVQRGPSASHNVIGVAEILLFATGCHHAYSLRLKEMTTLDKALVVAQSWMDTLWESRSWRSPRFWRVAGCCWKSHNQGGVSRSMFHFSLDFTAAHSDVLGVGAVFALSVVAF